MPKSCVERHRCGTDSPGWLNTAHPAVTDGAIQAKVCFHGSSGCCERSTNVTVRNCGEFYVYNFHPTPNCSLRYCGNVTEPTQGTVTFATFPKLENNCFFENNCKDWKCMKKKIKLEFFLLFYYITNFITPCLYLIRETHWHCVVDISKQFCWRLPTDDIEIDPG